LRHGDDPVSQAVSGEREDRAGSPVENAKRSRLAAVQVTKAACPRSQTLRNLGRADPSPVLGDVEVSWIGHVPAYEAAIWPSKKPPPVTAAAIASARRSRILA
jgi:hypothetical protein